MPSSPKRTAKTGSMLLGQELRRLRGGRSLREICDLTRTPPLSEHVGSLSEAGLCEIESGKSMPTLQKLHSLSVVYKVSMSQLMGYVTEERISGASTGLDASPAQLEADFQRLLRDHAWPAALSLAIRGEHVARQDAHRIAWRANRASSLSRMGLHDEALTILTKCSEAQCLSPRQKLLLLHNLAVTHLNAGHPATAAMVAREAIEMAVQADFPREDIAALELLRAMLIIEQEKPKVPQADERRVREAMRLLQSASSGWLTEDSTGKLSIRITQAEALHCLGNSLVAARDLEQLVKEASTERNDSVLAAALLALATVRQGQGHGAESTSLLERALKAAERASEGDLLFEAHFRLFLGLRDGRPGAATTHLRRCNELFPLVSAQTRWVREYESFQGASR